MIGREPALFHSTPKAFGAEPATPLAAVLAYQSDNAVSHLKKPLPKHCILRTGNQPGDLSELHRRVHRNRDCFQRPLQIGDCHPEFTQTIATKGFGLLW